MAIWVVYSCLGWQLEFTAPKPIMDKFLKQTYQIRKQMKCELIRKLDVLIIK